MVVFVFEIFFYPKIIKLMFLIFIFLYANIKIKKNLKIYHFIYFLLENIKHRIVKHKHSKTLTKQNLKIV